MRAQDVKVRLAQNSEAQRVAQLVSEIFRMEGWELKFESVFPHWLVAEYAGEIVGAINLRMSLPIASVEMLSLDPKLSHRERGIVASLLTDVAAVLATSMGAEAISSMIPSDQESYLKVAQNRGYVVGNTGSIVFGRTK